MAGDLPVDEQIQERAAAAQHEAGKIYRNAAKGPLLVLFVFIQERGQHLQQQQPQQQDAQGPGEGGQGRKQAGQQEALLAGEQHAQQCQQEEQAFAHGHP